MITRAQLSWLRLAVAASPGNSDAAELLARVERIAATPKLYEAAPVLLIACRAGSGLTSSPLSQADIDRLLAAGIAAAEAAPAALRVAPGRSVFSRLAHRLAAVRIVAGRAARTAPGEVRP